MYYGIEVVARPVDQWGIEELREFIGRNGEYLVERPTVSLNEGDLEKIGRDLEMVAGKLDSIVNVYGLEQQVEKLQGEVWNLEDADCDNCVALEDQLEETEKRIGGFESYISELEDEIDGLKDTIANLEEQLANREE